MWLIPTPGESRTGPVAQVALRLRSFDLYPYAVPEALRGQVRAGVRVRVPLRRGRRMAEGWCVGVSEGEWSQTSQLLEAATDSRPLLSEKLIELGLWISGYYACPPGMVFDAMTPPEAVRAAGGRKVMYVRRIAGAAEVKLTARQRALLEVIDGELPRAEALRRAGVGAAVLKGLLKAGVVEQAAREAAEGQAENAGAAAIDGPAEGNAEAGTHPRGDEGTLVLTGEQQTAVERIGAALGSDAPFRVLALLGVPGSGKTEVFVRSIRAAIAAGRQAIVLIPEIALATQIVERLARRFERVGVLHSRQTDRQRRLTYERIAGGAVDVVIGTRTAVFAPCARLGLIVVDEEQEGSYKSLSAPYYHARDVAIKRGQIEGAPVVLASATPSLETWFNLRHSPHFERIELPHRVPGAQPPRMRIIDMRAGRLGQDSVLLSPELVRALRDALAAGRQAILLHNRRGYATLLRCARCGLALYCERCHTPLVDHRAEDTLKCHRCGQRRPRPPHCLDDACKGPLERSGLAIQRLEEELGRAAPQARLLRLDRDTMRRREDYAAALGRFERGEADVLLGTQMVAKGLDFPRVALVGVVDADEMLGLPDFRAAERAFQLFVQVVGRAGRRTGDSLALIQTRQPQTRVLRAAAAMDYAMFAEEELRWREALADPPGIRLVRFILSDPRQQRAEEAAQRLCDDLRRIAGRHHAGIQVDDAQRCVVARTRGRARVQVLLRVPRAVALPRLFEDARREKLLSPRVERFVIDVDPVEMM